MKFARVFCFLVLAWMPAAGGAKEVDQGQLVSTVGHLLKEDHYTGRVFDEELARRVLRNFVDDLDYDHLYLIQPDVDALEAAYAPSLGQRGAFGEDRACAEGFRGVPAPGGGAGGEDSRGAEGDVRFPWGSHGGDEPGAVAVAEGRGGGGRAVA